MSNVSSAHSLMILKKDTKALSGQRLARVIAKATKGVYPPNLFTLDAEGNQVGTSLAVSLPPILDKQITPHLNALMPHITRMLENTQDAIVRELRISEGVDIVTTDDVSVDACIAYLTESAKGVRITEEYLQSWFLETYSSSAAEYIALAMKWEPEDLTEDQLSVVTQRVNGLAGLIGKCKSEKTVEKLDLPQLKGLVKFGGFMRDQADAQLTRIVETADKVLIAKLAAMTDDALGF